jgi:HD-GYP domain-containing protein (c-di-GMP phosphodiesterase class II)
MIENKLKNEDEVMEELNTSVKHGICVSNLAYLLAKKLGLSEELCYETAVAGMLHDIGRARAIQLLYTDRPDHNQNGRKYLVKEMHYLMRHPFLGYDCLKDQDYSDYILDSILFHHENYDGTGYPSNLKGDMIPLGARILRICETFVSLTSKKGFRPPHTKEEAVRLMIEDVKYYDMEIFLQFMNLVYEIDVDRDIKKNMDI